jgi:hypothetical protein
MPLRRAHTTAVQSTNYPAKHHRGSSTHVSRDVNHDPRIPSGTPEPTGTVDPWNQCRWTGDQTNAFDQLTSRHLRCSGQPHRLKRSAECIALLKRIA